MPSLYAHNFHISDARCSAGRDKVSFFDVISVMHQHSLAGSSRATDRDLPKEQSSGVCREPYIPAWAQGPF